MNRAGRTRVEWLLEAVALTALLGAVAIVAIHWERIPQPFRFRPPRSPLLLGPRTNLLILLGISACTYVFLSIAGSFQKLLSLPAVIDRDGPEVRRLVRSMTIVLKTGVMLLFCYFTWTMATLATGRSKGLSPTWIALLVLAVPIPLAGYTVKLLRYKK